MKKSIRSPFFCLLTILTVYASLLPLLVFGETKIVGYYPDWAIYRTPPFFPKDINGNLITHINYAFIKLDPSGALVLFDPWADIQYGQDWKVQRPYWGNFKELDDLKQQYPQLKTLASVGGWTLSDTFSQVAADPNKRQCFIQSCLQFCDTYNFDGIDIDWEYPCFADHGGHPEDKQNYTLLLSELYKAAKGHQPPLLISIAAPAASNHYLDIEVALIHPYLDWINLMCYDFHGPWPSSDPVTNHHSALYQTQEGDPSLNVDSAITYYLQQGVPREKIVVGMPFYGRSFAGANGLFSSYTGPGSGTTTEVGMRFFYDIKQNLLSTYQRQWDDQSKVPFLFSPEKQEFITYEDEISIGMKSQYIKEKGLGGAMIWELGLDVHPTWDLLSIIQSTLIPERQKTNKL